MNSLPSGSLTASVVFVREGQDAGGAVDLLLQLLVRAGAPGDEQVAVGQVGVAGAEEVLGSGDLLRLPGDRVPEDRSKGACLEPLGVVARAGDQQHLAGVQQRRVDRRQPELLRELEGLPEAVLRLVLLLVALELVPGVVGGVHHHRPVGGDHPGNGAVDQRGVAQPPQRTGLDRIIGDALASGPLNWTWGTATVGAAQRLANRVGGEAVPAGGGPAPRGGGGTDPEGDRQKAHERAENRPGMDGRCARDRGGTRRSARRRAAAPRPGAAGRRRGGRRTLPPWG